MPEREEPNDITHYDIWYFPVKLLMCNRIKS